MNKEKFKTEFGTIVDNLKSIADTFEDSEFLTNCDAIDFQKQKLGKLLSSLSKEDAETIAKEEGVLEKGRI